MASEMDEKELSKIQFGHLVRILTTLLELERGGYTASLMEIAEKSGVSQKTFFMGLKSRLIKAGLVVEENIPPRIKTLKLTETGRRLAECLEQCKRVLYKS